MRAAALLPFALLPSCLSARYEMTFGPAAVLPHQAYLNESLHSWGGSVIETPSDPLWRFHLYAAAFVEGCGLNAWVSNSQVIHGVSNEAQGPYTFESVALPVWHHNPAALLHSDGTFLLYSIGMLPEEKVVNCSRAEPARGRHTHGEELMQLHSAESPYGPWTLVSANIFNGTNPAPAELPDGSMLVGSHGTDFVVSSAPHWRGPYAEPVALFAPEGVVKIEDPFLWFDAAAQRWRVLLHQYNGTSPHPQGPVGGVASSNNASWTSEWTLQRYDKPVYNLTVGFADGSAVSYSRRERPKLLLNKTTGAPAVLFTGVCPEGAQSSACYTLSQPILTSGDVA